MAGNPGLWLPHGYLVLPVESGRLTQWASSRGTWEPCITPFRESLPQSNPIVVQVRMLEEANAAL
ncbi:MAG: hypothetical protein ACI9VI_001243 [Candidatus Azotimanducaceae bacterium]|jgi:hypothetical protein